MRILLLNTGADMYGGNRIFFEVSRHLKERGHTLHVILPYDGPIAQKFRALGMEPVFVNPVAIRRKYFSVAGIFNRIYVFNRSWFKLLATCKKHDVDLIYSNTLSIFIGFLLANRLKIRHLWHLHEILQHPKWMRWVFGWILNQSHGKIIAVSEAVKNAWSPVIKNPERIQVIYNGIYQPKSTKISTRLKDQLDLSGSEIIVGMIGRFNHWKGQKYLIKIAIEVLKKNKSVHFALVGDAYPGSEHLVHESEQMAVDNNIAEHVHFLGYKKNVIEFLRGIDIFVLPSTQPDPFPTVILEAMGCGKAIAATAHGGALEMLENGVSGLHIPWDDYQLAAEQLLYLIEDNDLRQEMGRKARKRVTHLYSEERFRDHILDIFEN